MVMCGISRLAKKEKPAQFTSLARRLPRRTRSYHCVQNVSERGELAGNFDSKLGRFLTPTPQNRSLEMGWIKT